MKPLLFLAFVLCASTVQSISTSPGSVWLTEIGSMMKIVSKDVPKQLAYVDGGQPVEVVVEQPILETFYARPALIYAIQAQNNKHDLIDFHGMLMQDIEDRRGYHWGDLVNEENPLFPWSPKLSPFHVRGAAEIYIQSEKGSTDVSLRVPNFVETGALSLVKVQKGTDIVVLGSSHVYLKDPIDVDITLPVSPAELIKSLKTSTTPRLVVKNPYQINSGDTKLKVKRIGKTQVEVGNDMKALQAVPPSSSSLSLYRDQTSLQLNSLLGSMSNSVQSMMLNNNNSNKKNGTGSAKPQLRIKRIVSASAKAVVLYEFATEVKFKYSTKKSSEEESESLLVDVAVVKDDVGEFSLVGVKQRDRFDTISSPYHTNPNNSTHLPTYSVELNDVSLSLPSPF